MINGRQHVLEDGIIADFGFVKAHKGDREGQPALPADGPQLQPAGRDVGTARPSPRSSTWSKRSRAAP